MAKKLKVDNSQPVNHPFIDLTVESGDEVPQVPGTPATRIGDVWLLGVPPRQHRVLVRGLDERGRCGAAIGRAQAAADGHRPALRHRVG